jgi:hypothetical protein
MSTSPEAVIQSFTRFGGHYHEDIIEWVQYMEEVFDQAEIPSSHKYIIAQYYLTGAAVKWFRFHEAHIPDWFTFKSGIIKAFQSSFIPTLQRQQPQPLSFSLSSVHHHSSKILQASRQEENPVSVPLSTSFEFP